MSEPAPRTKTGWGTWLAYALVALAAAAANVAAQRLGAPLAAGYLAAALVIVVSIGIIEWRRARRASLRQPDLQLLHADADLARVLERIRALERAGRPKAGVGIAIPPGACKLWVRHVEEAFEIHAFSVSAADAARLGRIEEIVQRAAGVKKLPADPSRPGVLTFRATLPAEGIQSIVTELLEGSTSVELWWSTTLGELPGEAGAEA